MEWNGTITNKVSGSDFEPQRLKPGLNGNSISKALKLRRDFKTLLEYPRAIPLSCYLLFVRHEGLISYA